MDSIESVYGQQSEFRKAPSYDNMARRGVFNMQVPDEHRERRRLMNHTFSQASINDTETSARDLIKKFMGIIDRHVGDKMEMKHWFRMLTLDIAGTWVDSSCTFCLVRSIY
jgi:cytochrome P450